MLDAEVQRINSTTRAPEMLAEIKVTLGNDPVKFAQVFANPILAGRLLREECEKDDALHAPQRRQHRRPLFGQRHYRPARRRHNERRHLHAPGGLLGRRDRRANTRRALSLGDADPDQYRVHVVGIARGRLGAGVDKSGGERLGHMAPGLAANSTQAWVIEPAPTDNRFYRLHKP